MNTLEHQRGWVSRGVTRERRHAEGMQVRYKEKAGEFEVSAAVGVKSSKTKGGEGCPKCPRGQRLKGITKCMGQ